MTDAVLPPPDHAEASRPASASLAGTTPAPFWFLLAAQFVVAAAGLVVEIVAGRMLAPYVGMSLYTWTAVIAVVLAGFSAGHWAGGLVADRPARTGLMWLAVSGALGAITTIAALPLLRWVSGPVLSSLTDPVAGIVALAMLLFFLPSFAAGIPSPILARLAIEDRVRSGRALGALHAVSAIGAIAGTLAAGYLFISWLGTARTLITVAAAYSLFALCCLWMARGCHAIQAAVRSRLRPASRCLRFSPPPPARFCRRRSATSKAATTASARWTCRRISARRPG